ISTDDARDRALAAGAFAFLAKPVQGEADIDALLARTKAFVQRSQRTLLAVSEDDAYLEWCAGYLADDDLHVMQAKGLRTARDLLAEHAIDCVLWDRRLTLDEAELRAASAAE